MADPMQMPRLDAYAQDLLRQSYGQSPVSSDVLARFGQGMMQQAAPVPQVESYAPQQTMQPDPRRLEYAKRVEQRFNELAQTVGGMEELIATGTVDIARQRALKDVEMLYGPAPTIEQPQKPLQVQPIPGTEKVMVYGAGMQSPQFIEAAKPAEPAQMQPIFDAQGQPIPGMGMLNGEVKTFEAPQKAAEAKAKAASENIGLAADVVSTVDNLLADENALQWAGGMTGSVLGKFPGTTSGIRQKIEQLRDQIGLFGRKAIVGQGQGSISDAEQKMAKEAMAQIITEGTDEQLINSLKAVRQKFGGILDRLQSEPIGSPQQQQPSQPSIQRRVFVPGKGFQ